MTRPMLLLIVLALTCAVYANSLQGEFTFDDVAVLQWLDGGMTSFVANEMGIAHRPLPYFTYWLNFIVGSRTPFWYHVVNLFFHLIAVTLVFFLVEHLLRKGRDWWDPPYHFVRYAAAFGAAVFGVHPFFSGAVSYIYGRGSIMAACFVFGAALAALKLKGLWPWIVVPGLLACGVLSKEEALIAPALFLGYAVIHRHWTAAQGLLVAMIIGLVAVMLLTPHIPTVFNTTGNVNPVPDLVMNYGEGPSVQDHRKAVLSGYAFHTLGNLILPLWLTPDPALVTDKRWIGAVAIILALSALALSVKIPADIRMAVWALLCCPILGAMVVLLAEPLFEYRAYSMGLGVALLAGAIFLRLARLRPGPALACVVIAALSAGTIQRNQVWSTVIGLWQDASNKDPWKKRPALNLSAALLKAKRDIEAERVLLDILVKYPAFRAGHINLAAVYIENKRCDAGEHHARYGVPVPIAFTYIALCQASWKDFDNALINVESAIRIDPQMMYAQSVRLSILNEMGRTQEEITRLEQETTAKPNDRIAHATLSMAYRIAGLYDAADEQSRISKQLDINVKEND